MRFTDFYNSDLDYLEKKEGVSQMPIIYQNWITKPIFSISYISK
jgi:hypothetical protein